MSPFRASSSDSRGLLLLPFAGFAEIVQLSSEPRRVSLHELSSLPASFNGNSLYSALLISLARATVKHMARFYNIPPRYVARWLATHLTGGERGVPMKDDRLRVARLCGVLTQRSLLGASRLLRLGRCVDSNFRPGRFLGASARSSEATFTV